MGFSTALLPLGLSSPPGVAPATVGFHGLLAFWLGGAGADSDLPPPEPPSHGGGYGVDYEKRLRRKQFQEREFALLTAAKTALVAPVLIVKTESGKDVTPAIAKKIAANAAVVEKKYAQIGTLNFQYGAQLAGVTDAIVLVDQKINALVEDELMFMVAMLTGLDDDA